MDRIIPKKLVLALVLLLCILLIGTIGYIIIEKWDFLDSLYMTVITLTTVGFGEVKPLSHNGRIFTICLILSGFGILTYGITSGISFLMEGELGHILRRRKMNKQIQNTKDHYILCATGEIGEYVTEEFIKTKRPLVVITTDNELLEKLEKHNVPTIVDNPAEDESLIKAGIQDAKGLVTVLEDDKYNLFVVLSARGLNPGIKIVAQAIDKSTVIKIKKAGADEVVLTDAIGGMRIASAMLRPTVVSFLDGMLKGTTEQLRVEEAMILGQSHLVGKTIAESSISEKTGLIIIAIKDMKTGAYVYNPGPSYELKLGDVLIVIGNPDQVQSLYKLTKSDL
ncbi:MAG: potassium channel protein [Endomicrobiales bacterium]|nr:potassium channel protein [Endomicrobiales bacterium]